MTDDEALIAQLDTLNKELAAFQRLLPIRPREPLHAEKSELNLAISFIRPKITAVIQALQEIHD